jgi:hypothetical protein
MATVHQVIELAAQLSEEERRVVVDAIAPKESVEELAHAWGEEIARRAARVRAGDSKARPSAGAATLGDQPNRHPRLR